MPDWLFLRRHPLLRCVKYLGWLSIFTLGIPIGILIGLDQKFGAQISNLKYYYTNLID
jgi:hypothetical protein